MNEVWSLPGYDVQTLTASGDWGQLWRAREVTTGETVGLQRPPAEAAPGEADALRHRVGVLRRLAIPHVVRVRAVVEQETGLVLVLEHAAGGTLAALLSRRGTLDAGEVVTVAAPLAAALAAAHAAGLVHGAVVPETVLFTADGMPMLAGLGVAPAAGADPAVDVLALASACRSMLLGTPPPRDTAVGVGLGEAPPRRRAPDAPPALVAAVERGLSAEPAQRPDAAAFASLLRRACPPAPVRLAAARSGVPAPAAGPSGAGRHAARRRPSPVPRRPSSAAVAAVGAVLLVVAGAVGGWQWGRAGGTAAQALHPAPGGAASAPASPAQASPRASPAGAPARAATSGASPPAVASGAADWARVVDALDAARAAAFERADPAALSAVYAPGSAGLAADGRLVQQLAAAGHSAHGVRHAVRSVQVLEATADRARLRVVDVLAPHEVRDGTGAVVRRAPPRGEAAHLVQLVRTPSGWRLVEVRPA